MAADEPSYVDYETFLAPDFSPAAFANALVVATNNPHDSPLDLSTPLSRVLFDAQEVDSHIDLLATRSAVPLLRHTEAQTAASRRIVEGLDAHVRSLNDSYRQLERDVIDKHAEADEVRRVALRLWEALRLARSVARCLQLGRQLQLQHAELDADHAALVSCAHTVLSLREVVDARGPGDEGDGLDAVAAIAALRQAVTAPLERAVRDAAEAIVADFAMDAATTYARAAEARPRLESALVALYLLSPTLGVKPDKWTPRLLVEVLERYMRSALQTCIAALSRSLGQLPSLNRALAEAAAKCQSIAALEAILASTKPPPHPLLPAPAPAHAGDGHADHAKHDSHAKRDRLLQPLLAQLETGSLPSYFWRSVAGSLAAHVQDIVARGGVVARTLKANKQGVADAIRDAVVKGCQPPPALLAGPGTGPGTGPGQARRPPPEAPSWDREVAVMVGCVLNNLGR